MTDSSVDRRTFGEYYEQYQAGRELFLTARAKYRAWKSARENRSKYFVSVEDEDELFIEIQRWLMKDTDFDKQQSIMAFSSAHYDDEDHRTVEVELFTEHEYSTQVQIADRLIDVEITNDKPNLKKNQGDDPVAEMAANVASATYIGSFSTTKRAVFAARDMYERDLVISRLREIANELSKRERKASFNMVTGNGYWRRASHLMKRPLDTVILAGDNKERLLRDFEKFISEESRYRELGLPWHHGYMLEGPPGTGKTSLISAVASYFDMDVYYIPLSVIESDTVLSSCMSSISSNRAVVVMEDVDIVSATRDRDDSRKGVTLQGLLNALDGIGTPHGLVTVMTTNDIGVLDPALIRPGRVDFTLHVGYVNDDQVQRLCKRFMGRTFDLPHVVGEISPAEIVGLFKINDEDTVEEKLNALIAEKNLQVQAKDSVQTEPTEV